VVGQEVLSWKQVSQPVGGVSREEANRSLDQRLTVYLTGEKPESQWESCGTPIWRSQSFSRNNRGEFLEPASFEAPVSSSCVLFYVHKSLGS
jgi:hypothetical protein